MDRELGRDGNLMALPTVSGIARTHTSHTLSGLAYIPTTTIPADRVVSTKSDEVLRLRRRKDSAASLAGFGVVRRPSGVPERIPGEVSRLLDQIRSRLVNSPRKRPVRDSTPRFAGERSSQRRCDTRRARGPGANRGPSPSPCRTVESDCSSGADVNDSRAGLSLG